MDQRATALQTALTGFLTLVFAMGVGRFAFTPLLPMMQDEGLLDVEQGGVLASVHFIGYAMGAFLAGALTGSPRALLVCALGVIGLATGAMGFGTSPVLWLVARWAAGVCSALALVVVSSHVLKQLSALGRPDLAGWVFAGVGAGIAFAGLGTVWLMQWAGPSAVGWQVFGLATLAAALAVCGLARHMPATPAAPDSGAQSGGPQLNWHIILPYGTMGAGYIIPATYLPVMAQQTISDPLVFGWSWPLFGLAAALSTLVSARLHQRYSNRTIWIASQLIMAAGLLLPALTAHISTVLIGGICVGGTFMVITVAGLREAHRLAGPGSAQRHIAAMTAAFAVGQIVGPPAAGWAYDLDQSFAYPLLLAAALLVLTVLPLMTRVRKAGAAGERNGQTV